MVEAEALDAKAVEAEALRRQTPVAEAEVLAACSASLNPALAQNLHGSVKHRKGALLVALVLPALEIIVLLGIVGALRLHRH